jgi:hypothetical protein
MGREKVAQSFEEKMWSCLTVYSIKSHALVVLFYDSTLTYLNILTLIRLRQYKSMFCALAHNKLFTMISSNNNHGKHDKYHSFLTFLPLHEILIQ